MRPTDPAFERDRTMLADAEERGLGSKLIAYSRLSGPGWLQSAITLGGGSLASSLYLGVVGGVAFLWVQPLAMILGIIMLSGIAYITLSTQERPFAAINEHVSPVLGWGWALASLAANIFWCMPQYVLATGVLEQNLLPGWLGPDGSLVAAASASFGETSWLATNAAKLVIVAVILLLSTIVTWCYSSGGWGIRLYEVIVKMMVAGIVLCFVGVVWALAGELDWPSIAAGLIPDLSKWFQPSDAFAEVLKTTTQGIVWSEVIVSEQRELMISAAATAVGINMTFLFPYSLLRKRWTREFRGLAVFDLSTGMLIPFVIATSCVVIAAANRFHTVPAPGFFGEMDKQGEEIVANKKMANRYYELLAKVLPREIGDERLAQLIAADIASAEAEGLAPSSPSKGKAVREVCDRLEEPDRRIAAMLVRREPFDLAMALQPLAGNQVANLVFGLGVLGMALSTITMLMLISGFVICEMFRLPLDGWAFRLSCLAAATGVLGPFIWSRAAFYLAVWVSAFGMILLPLAYLSFWFLMNRKALLGTDMPTGRKRLWWNLAMGIATLVASVASLYTLWRRAGVYGIGALGLLILLALIVHVVRPRPAHRPVAERRLEGDE